MAGAAEPASASANAVVVKLHRLISCFASGKVEWVAAALIRGAGHAKTHDQLGLNPL